MHNSNHANTQDMMKGIEDAYVNGLHIKELIDAHFEKWEDFDLDGSCCIECTENFAKDSSALLSKLWNVTDDMNAFLSYFLPELKCKEVLFYSDEVQ